MAGYNRVVLVGNLTRDPEYKQLTSGQAVCRLGLASNRQFKNRQSGALVQEVCYIDIDVWGPQAESCKQFLQKGRPVLIEGRLKLDSWKDAEGQNKSKHSIVADRVIFLGNGNGAESGAAYESGDSMQPARLEPKTQMEEDVLQKLDAVKFRAGARKTPASGGEVDFADEPPFQDDLPF